MQIVYRCGTVWTNAIRDLDGNNSPFPCNLGRLRGSARNRGGRPWIKAEIFTHLARSPLEVDAASLYLDRNCRVRVFALVDRRAH